MISLVFALFILAPLYAILEPLVTFLRDKKGFRKFPMQNWLSGITASAYGWEVGREHKVFHTRRLHDALMKNPVIRVGPNWLSFGNSGAVKDISPCNKGAIYASLQGGGKNMLDMVDRSEYSDRRRIAAVAYAPKKIESWEPDVARSVARLLKRMDEMCTPPLSPEESIPKNEDLMFDGVHWSYLFAVEAVVKIGLSKGLLFIKAGNDLFAINDTEGKVRQVSVRRSFRGGVRATSTVVWDTRWYPCLIKVTRALSTKYRKNWQHGEDSSVRVRQLIQRRRLDPSLSQDRNRTTYSAGLINNSSPKTCAPRKGREFLVRRERSLKFSKRE